MRIAVSADERTHLVDAILADLAGRGHTVDYIGPAAGSAPGSEVDEGSGTEADGGSDGATANWPDVTLRAAEAVASGLADEAIVMCWTGTGASIAANKVRGIRAALCHDAETAKGARTWNHANVLALSLRATSEPMAKEILDAWFATPFGDGEWNRRQVARVGEIEAASQVEEATHVDPEVSQATSK